MKLSSLYKVWEHPLKREKAALKIEPMDGLGFITYRCTSRCKTCTLWQRPLGGSSDIHGELTPNEWEMAMKSLARSGVKSFEIFGGDAFLRKDAVYEILKISNTIGIKTFFPTNSNLLDMETAIEITKHGLSTLYFSIDGFLDLHNEIRGTENTYTKANDAIFYVDKAKKDFKANFPEIRVLSTVSKYNIASLDTLINEFNAFPLHSVTLRSMAEMTSRDADSSRVDGIKSTPFFVSSTDESNLLTYDEYISLKKFLKNIRKNPLKLNYELNIRDISTLPKITFTHGIYPDYPCHVCTTVVTLTPYGDIVPCPNYTDYILGNIKNKNSLNGIWGNEKHKKFLKAQKKGELYICRKCCMRQYYPGVRETFDQLYKWYVKQEA